MSSAGGLHRNRGSEGDGSKMGYVFVGNLCAFIIPCYRLSLSVLSVRFLRVLQKHQRFKTLLRIGWMMLILLLIAVSWAAHPVLQKQCGVLHM